MNPENLNAEWARVIVSGLRAAGVQHVVASPGARSAPVLCALLNEAWDVQMVLDERSAAFVALGRARATGRPQLVLRTSGTAAGHDLPAVMEARRAGLPLIVLSADRPNELAHSAAPQTTDQIGLFASQAGATVELGMPEAVPEALAGLLRRVVQSVALSQWPTPGPVHINVRARKPLEPQVAKSDAARALSASVDALLKRGAPSVVTGSAHLAAHQMHGWIEQLGAAPRRLVVAGPQHPGDVSSAAAQLAKAWKCPLICEAGSQLRSRPEACSHAELSLWDAAFAAEQTPDVIVQFGPPPIGRGWQAFAKKHRGAKRLTVGAVDLWLDPDNTASTQVAASPKSVARLLAGAVAPGSDEALSQWQKQGRRAAAVLEHVLQASDASVLGELQVAQAALTAVAASDGFIFLGNGLPVRHVEVLGTSVDIPIYTQRGLNGIDGLVAQAAGVAQATGTSGTLLLGDLSLRHDVSSLSLLLGLNVKVVVIHNGGGRIFEALPMQDSLPSAHMEHFTTPNQSSLLPWAEAAGLVAVRVQSSAELRDALQSDAQFIEAVVDPSEARSTREQLREQMGARTADQTADQTAQEPRP